MALDGRQVWFSSPSCLLAGALLIAPVSSPRIAAAGDGLAEIGVIYATLGNSGPNTGSLITISPTGAGTLVGSTGIVGALGDRGVPALGVRSTGELYAMSIESASKLYRVDASTGAATLVATTNLLSPPAIAFGAKDILFAVDGSGNLHVLNDVTGASTLRGPTGAAIKGLAFDPTDGVLWGSDSNSGIFTIDLGNGSATLVGETGLAPSPDIFFDLDGMLYGSSGGGLALNNLIQIDKSTGAGTVIGPIGFQSVAGMTLRLDTDIPTAALVSLVAAELVDGSVSLWWYSADPPGTVYRLDRSADGAAWTTIAQLRADGMGHVRHTDRNVTGGSRYGYRLAVLEEAGWWYTEPVWFEVPVSRLHLAGAIPNPADGARLTIDLTLANGPASASLELVDVSGRRLAFEDLSSLGPGRHMMDIARGSRIPAGIYFARLTQGTEQIMKKVSVIE